MEMNSTNTDSMGTMYVPPRTPQSSFFEHKSVVYALAALVVIAIGAVVWLGRGYLHSAPAQPAFAPTGTLYLSLKPQGATGSNIYAFSISAHTLTKIAGTGTGMNLTPGIMPDGIMYVSNDIGGGKYLKVPQIFELLSTGSTTQLSTTLSPWKRAPKYSATLNKIVYEGRTAITKTQTSAPSDSIVYLLSDKTHGVGMTSGALPQLTPSGTSVVVLRNDGLYMTSLVSTSTAEKIWGVNGGSVGVQDQFAVSPDGKHIAWTIPDKGHLYVMTVDSWAPFSGRVTSDIVTTALWPVFSPDSQSLAYADIDLTGTAPSNARITIQSLVSGTRKTVQSLAAFDAKNLFLTAWGG